MGETRTLLLEARLLRHLTVTAQHKARLQELRGMRPALSQCRLLAKILSQWEAWTTGAPDPDRGGYILVAVNFHFFRDKVRTRW
jgi:hypothetical protein